MTEFGKSRAPMVAAIGTQAWEVATTRQRAASADHGEFYALAAEVVATLHALENLTRVLSRQVGSYGQAHRLRDDSGTVDPAARLAHALGDLIGMEAGLRRSSQAANHFWSAIGHIAVEEGP